MGRFRLDTKANPGFVRGDHSLQYLVAPQTRTRVGFTWDATYRGTPRRGRILVVDAAQSALGEQLVLDDAWTVFDQIDLHASLLGRTTASMGDPWFDIHFPVLVQRARPI